MWSPMRSPNDDTARAPTMTDQIDRSQPRLLTLLAMLVVAGLAIRVAFMDIVSPDAHYYLLPWFDQLSREGLGIIASGLANAEGEIDANYSPPYYYLLWLASGPDAVIPPLWTIKLISIAAAGLGAFFAYRIIRLKFSCARAISAAALVFVAPTAILDDSWLAQCDMIWASLILGSLYFSLQRRYLAAMTLFGVGVAFKAQAIFFSPFLFMLFLRREIGIRDVLAAPAAYVVMMIPAIAAGATWADTLLTYLRQGEVYTRLSMHAPNLYYFAGEHFYQPGLIAGLIATSLTCFVLALVPVIYKAELDYRTKLLAATMFLLLAPFLLPKMHDRYFFAADMASIVLAVAIPRLWPVPVMLQVSSSNAYVAMMSWSLTDHFVTATLPMAAMLNTVLLVYLIVAYVRACMHPQTAIGEHTRPLLAAACAVILANAIWMVIFASHAVVSGRVCPGNPASALCSISIPGDWAINGAWPHWLAFLVLQAACIPIGWQVVRYLARWDWNQRFGLVRSWILGRA